MPEQDTWKTLLDQLGAEFQFRDNELQLLHDIDLQILSSQSNLTEVLRFIAHGTQALIGADHVQIMLQRGESLETTYSVADVDNGQRIPIDHSITGLCFSTNEVVNAGDTAAPPFDHLYKEITGLDQ